MLESKVFHKSIKGVSHIASGKPCQDFSGVFQDEDVKIVVVCDGHGGSTYFRSDVGAQIATEITIQTLKNFSRCVPASTFKGFSFSITAQPKRNPFIDADGNKLRFEELNDDQKKLALQAQNYLESVEKCPNQQELIKELLSQIYNEWMYAIKKDSQEHPFTRKEEKVLSGQGIEKAYGCTLLAFLQTQDYWLSFHIGDGRIMCCDKSLKWYHPVPDDCACFLNYTTSLCDTNPLIEFRYAFNGIDDQPLSVMLCSDGLDGSLRTDENLEDFYEQIIGLCMDGDDVESELEGYLPSLSESGNKDDISIAGIVNLSQSDEFETKRAMDFRKRDRAIRNDYRIKKSEIESICSKLEVLKMKYERVKDTRFEKQTELDDLRQHITASEREVSELDKSVETLRNEIDELMSDLKKKQQEFEDWKFTIKNEMAELESSENRTDFNDINNVNNNFTNW